MAEILIIEDDKDIVQALVYNLEKEGHRVSRAFDGVAGLRSAREKSPELILLDLMLPGISGLELCRTLRSEPKTATIPIIMLTARSTETDKVVGLEMGADDYLTKPFSMRELLARVKTVLKRTSRGKTAPKNQLKFRELEINVDRHQVTVQGKPVELTAKEFALLKYLAENAEKALSREKLLDTVWGIDQVIETRTVDVHLRRLREKLGRSGKYLKTLRGVGYKFSAGK